MIHIFFILKIQIYLINILILFFNFLWSHLCVLHIVMPRQTKQIFLFRGCHSKNFLLIYISTGFSRLGLKVSIYLLLKLRHIHIHPVKWCFHKTFIIELSFIERFSTFESFFLTI